MKARKVCIALFLFLAIAGVAHGDVATDNKASTLKRVSDLLVLLDELETRLDKLGNPASGAENKPPTPPVVASVDLTITDDVGVDHLQGSGGTLASQKYGGTHTLRWTGDNIASCTGVGFSTGSESPARNTSGISTGGLVKAEYVYTISCATAPGAVDASGKSVGTVSDTVVVNVVPEQTRVTPTTGGQCGSDQTVTVNLASNLATSFTYSINGGEMSEPVQAAGGVYTFTHRGVTPGSLNTYQAIASNEHGSSDIGSNTSTVPQECFDYDLSASPKSFTVFPGESITSTISLLYKKGVKKNVSLSLEAELPGAGHFSFTPAEGTPDSPALTSTFSLNTGTAPVGTYLLTVKGAHDSTDTSHSDTISITIAPRPVAASVDLTITDDVGVDHLQGSGGTLASQKYGGTHTLRWTGDNIASCTGVGFSTGSESPARNTAGLSTSGLVKATYEYTITCSTVSNALTPQVSDTISITVSPPLLSCVSDQTKALVDETVTWSALPVPATLPTGEYRYNFVSANAAVPSKLDTANTYAAQYGKVGSYTASVTLTAPGSRSVFVSCGTPPGTPVVISALPDLTANIPIITGLTEDADPGTNRTYYEGLAVLAGSVNNVAAWNLSANTDVPSSFTSRYRYRFGDTGSFTDFLDGNNTPRAFSLANTSQNGQKVLAGEMNRNVASFSTMLNPTPDGAPLYLKLCVDEPPIPNGIVQERNETNNCSNPIGPFTIIARPEPPSAPSQVTLFNPQDSTARREKGFIFSSGANPTDAFSSPEMTLAIHVTSQKPLSFDALTGLESPFSFSGGVFPGTGGTCQTNLTDNCTMMITFKPRSAEGVGAQDFGNRQTQFLSALRLHYKEGGEMKDSINSFLVKGIGKWPAIINSFKLGDTTIEETVFDTVGAIANHTSVRTFTFGKVLGKNSTVRAVSVNFSNEVSNVALRADSPFSVKDFICSGGATNSEHVTNCTGIVEYIPPPADLISHGALSLSWRAGERIEGDIVVAMSGEPMRTLSPRENLLVVYNEKDAESIAIKDYYLSHRPGFTEANTFAIRYPMDDCPSGAYYCSWFPDVVRAKDEPSDDANGGALTARSFQLFNSIIRQPITNWLLAHPEKEIYHIVLLRGVPSRIFNQDWYLGKVGQSVQYHLSFGYVAAGACTDEEYAYPPTTYEKYVVVSLREKNGLKKQCDRSRTEAPSLYYSPHAYPATVPLMTRLDMGSVDATKSYIDKLATVYNLMKNKSIIISASDASLSGDSYYFDDSQDWGIPVAAGFRDEMVNNFPLVRVQYQGMFPGSNFIATAKDVAGYLSWGVHNAALGGTYATDGKVRFSGKSGWYLIETFESFNGRKSPLSAGHGNFEDWFSAGAFGGSSYQNTPVGAVGHAEEPGLSAVNSPSYFTCWESGELLINCAWASIQGTAITVFGDPWVRK